jgi:hypothetical protein
MAQALEAQAVELMAPDKFNQTLTVPGTDKHGPLKVTYAIGGPEHGDDVPTIVSLWHACDEMDRVCVLGWQSSGG